MIRVGSAFIDVSLVVCVRPGLFDPRDEADAVLDMIVQSVKPCVSLLQDSTSTYVVTLVQCDNFLSLALCVPRRIHHIFDSLFVAIDIRPIT